jgi:hypothetical protein
MEDIQPQKKGIDILADIESARNIIQGQIDNLFYLE